MRFQMAALVLSCAFALGCGPDSVGLDEDLGLESIIEDAEGEETGQVELEAKATGACGKGVKTLEYHVPTQFGGRVSYALCYVQNPPKNVKPTIWAMGTINGYQGFGYMLSLSAFNPYTGKRLSGSSVYMAKNKKFKTDAYFVGGDSYSYQACVRDSLGKVEGYKKPHWGGPTECSQKWRLP